MIRPGCFGGLAAAVLLAAAAGASEYRHNLPDYEAFRARHPDVLEPNYLPFMVYRVPLADDWWRAVQRALGAEPPEQDRLVFCRWAEQDMPLRVYLDPPAFGPEWEEELRPPRPGPYVAAAERALSFWQRDLDEVVRFERTPSPALADLELRLLPQEAPFGDPSVQVLGATHVKDSCQVLEGGPEDDRLEVRYRVQEVAIYMVDAHGLLLPDQVEKVALHELGHALGMRGHSPIPADLMFPVARDRITRDGLGVEDVNSFLSLYAIPNGTVYADPTRPPREQDSPRLPPGEPQLSLAPYVDARLGFEVQTPRGWVRIPTRYGLAAVNGVAWAHEASLQVNVHRYDSVEEYLERYFAGHVRASAIVEERSLEKDGRRGLQLRLRTRRASVERLSFLESGDGRVLVSIAECPAELEEAYAPWFDAVLDSLEVVPEPAGGQRPPRDRDYSPGG